MTSSTGTSVQAYSYDPYGNQVTGSTTLSNFAYQEQQTEYDNDLQYLRARYYDTKNGRFLSRDPVAGTLATPASQNGYNYAHANPINLSDPSGEFVPLLIGGALLVWSAYDVSQGILNCNTGQAASGAIGLIPGVGSIGKIGKVVFQSEHVAKHLTKTNIPQQLQEQAIKNDLVSRGLPGQYVTRDIKIEGQTFEYRAYRLPDGNVSVGTYFAK